jgi:ATP-dependent DNA helicase UvrD/PcrA
MVTRLGTLARCSSILADYESVRIRARPDPRTPGAYIGGVDRGHDFYMWLALHIRNWAFGAYEGFEGEEDLDLDAVDLTTIHKAKGLEWPVVFVPSATANRFPSSKTGTARVWHVPLTLFDRSRYEGTENDERRLFYVALTRARDWVSVSRHDVVNTAAVQPSKFFLEMAGAKTPFEPQLPPPASAEAGDDDRILTLTFSALADYAKCPFAYRLRNLIGLQPPLAEELGYGKAVHHVLRRVSEHYRRNKSTPSSSDVDRLFDQDFYLPFASKPAHQKLKKAARRLVDRYLRDYSDDLARVWEVERPFELHLPDAIISGRADVILDREDGRIASLAIVDYKVSLHREGEYVLQQQVYTNAGRREGLPVTAAYLHDLDKADRLPIDVSDDSILRSEHRVTQLTSALRQRDFTPDPTPEKCKPCDMRRMCRFAS